MSQEGSAVHMEGIVKRFPGGVVANDHVTIAFARGEIHALLGENGAGKTTLMNILYGLYRPDEGRIGVYGQEVEIPSSRKAIELGIGMVHQNFMLVNPFTVVENVLLGLPGVHRILLDTRRARRRVESVTEDYDLTVNPDAKVVDLSVGEQQRVEIIKALYRGARILILDEPTSVLTPKETEQLFTNLKNLKNSEHTIIFISHKLDEVMAITDRISVLRDGKVVGTLPTREADKTSLAKMMVGREVLFRLNRDAIPPGPALVELEDLRVNDDRGLPAVRGLNLEIHAGEILGIAGVDGNGQRELAEAIYGLRPAESGTIRIKGEDSGKLGPVELIPLGVTFISDDKLGEGLVGDFSVAENLALREHKKRPFSSRGLLNLKSIRDRADQLGGEYGIRAGSMEAPVKLLSGGNQQKVILARELAGKPDVIIASQPTRGLDIGAAEFVKRQLLRQRARGSAILFVSADLEDVISISDRIAVIYEGRITGIIDGPDFDREEIGLLMAGAGQDESRARAGSHCGDLA